MAQDSMGYQNGSGKKASLRKTALMTAKRILSFRPLWSFLTFGMLAVDLSFFNAIPAFATDSGILACENSTVNRGQPNETFF
jgi:hypothetical protein